MARIELKQLQKVYGGSIAVADLNLTIENSELLVFLGPSGCGKTTTMNMIAGLTAPTSGRILFDGQDMTDAPPHTRNSAMVFQSSLLYPHLSARKNILMSLRHSKLSAGEKADRVAEASAILNIERLMDKLPSQMSGGERQRVATAKAIVRHPSIFLLDEPFAALDAALRLNVRAELINLQKRLQTTMVLVTHDQVEAMTMGDRIAVMRAGRIQQIDTPNAIYRRPANLFVAGFVGSPPMNFFEGAIVGNGDRFRFESAQLKLDLPKRTAAAAGAARGGVTLGIRPQELGIAKVSDQNSAMARVYAVEHLGSEALVILEGADGRKYRSVVPPGFESRIGEGVDLLTEKANPLLFDTQSEMAIF